MKKLSILCTALASLMLLTGCGVELQNKQAAQELSERAKLPGSVSIGWRVFQDKCAACHGAAATGMGSAPDLLPKVRDMSSRQFVSLVLKRYDLNQPTLQIGSGSFANDVPIETIMQRKDAPLTMPAWEGEPRVNAHIADLYAYLSARADGSQGSGRPAP